MAEIFRKYLTRARSEKGFTLIELLVVLVILGILLAIAVPSYLGFRDRAQSKAAASNVRAAVPSVEAFYSDHSTYAGMTEAELKAIDRAVKVSVNAGSLGVSTYCIYNTQGTHVWHKTNPSGPVTSGAC